VPTYQRTPRFAHDWKHLTQDVRDAFRRVVREQFVPGLERGKFRPQLRVKRVQAVPGVREMTFGPDGRATFEHGPGERGDPYVIWRRIGTHEVFRSP
jgi:hypothetical protein